MARLCSAVSQIMGLNLRSYKIHCWNTWHPALASRVLSYKPPASMQPSSPEKPSNSRSYIADVGFFGDPNDGSYKVAIGVLYVKTLTGVTTTLDYYPHDTVERLMQRIEEKKKTPPDEQRLIYCGKQLEKG